MIFHVNMHTFPHTFFKDEVVDLRSTTKKGQEVCPQKARKTTGARVFRNHWFLIGRFSKC